VTAYSKRLAKFPFNLPQRPLDKVMTLFEELYLGV